MQMKQLIPAPIPPAEDFQPKDEFPNEVARLVSAARAKGYQVTPDGAAQLWCRYSESLCACWLSISSPDDDEALVSCMLKYAVVTDVAAGMLPPPEGYHSWLDYAVATLDVSPAELEHLLADERNRPTGEVMRNAARAELEDLRRRAGL
jgi:hypothetical protein